MSDALARVDFDDDAGVATLTMCRAEKRNAMSFGLIEAVRARIEEVRAHKHARALIVRGEGPALCAGMDLKAVLGDPAGSERLLAGIGELTIALFELDAVVVAQVHGAAIGGGCGIVCATDLAVCAESAKLGFPEVDLGLCPAVVSPWVHRTLGAGRARRVLLTGGTMSAREALELGIVHEVVPDGRLAERTVEVARGVAKGGSRALAATKHLLGELDGERLVELVRRGAGVSAGVLASDEAQARLGSMFGDR